MRTALLAASLLLLSACAGVAARNKALLPAMASAYTGIYADIHRGIKAKELTPIEKKHLYLLALDLGDALKSSDYRRVMRVDWPRLREVAILGITARVAAGEIGTGVADSFLERVDQFTRSYQLLGAG